MLAALKLSYLASSVDLCCGPQEWRWSRASVWSSIHINININIYIYIYKGHDRANTDVADAADEIKAHIDTRWVGPDEAIWRLLEFPLHGSSYSTQCLATHLPGEK